MGGFEGAGAGGGGGGKVGVGLPALDVALAFPQATPASHFPPAEGKSKSMDLHCQQFSQHTYCRGNSSRDLNKSPPQPVHCPTTTKTNKTRGWLHEEIKPGPASAPQPGPTQSRVTVSHVFDYYQLDDFLTNEEKVLRKKVLRKKVQGVMEKEIAPIMTEYWEKAEFPFHVIPKLATLGLAGGTTKGYGCPGLSLTAAAISTAEVARVDASCSTFILVHASLVMPTIALCGSEAQKQQYLPSLAQFKMIGCWALTEPDYGSDASSLRTSATKVPGGWHLNGQKRWIGNSTFADILIILARNAETKQLNGFIVKKGAPGLKATKIENKIGLRMVQNGDIVLNKVFVPEEDRLPGINSFQDINKVFAMSRVLVTWQPIGISMGVFDMCHRYLKERKQFGAPLAAFELNQEKLVRMLGNVQAMLLVGWRLCKLYEAGKLTPGHSSLGKAWTSRMAREVVSLGRELLGGNGILADFLVAKAFCDLEPIFSYEGTYDINSLVAGREITGIASFKPAAMVAKSRM